MESKITCSDVLFPKYRASSPVTFNLNCTKPEKIPSLLKNPLIRNVQSHPIITDFEGRKIVYAHEKENAFTPSVRNGFVGTVFEAYCHHYNLTLRPDDVWIAIIVAFGRYVDANAEAMRSLFVEHEGKKSLIVPVAVQSPKEIDWNKGVEMFSKLIEKNTKNDIKEWCVANFSTTTELDRFVSQLALMGAMRHYFQYEFMCICGIPSITLEGTLEDWQDIRKRVDKLNDYELTEWSQLLGTILDEFIAAYQGNANVDFWNSICYYEQIKGRGGAYFPDRNYLSGWVLAFAPFNDEGKYQLKSNEEIIKEQTYGKIDIKYIPLCTIQVPVKISTMNKEEFNYILYGGMMQSLWDNEKKEIRPSVDYVIIDDTQSKLQRGKAFSDEVQKDKYGHVMEDKFGNPIKKERK